MLIVSSAGAVASGAIYGKKLSSKKKKDAVEFRQLSQMQTGGEMEEDEDDEESEPLVQGRVHDDSSHLWLGHLIFTLY